MCTRYLGLITINEKILNMSRRTYTVTRGMTQNT